MKRLWTVLAVLLLTQACEPTPTSVESARAPKAILDATHDVSGAPGNPHFFFLPPMVPAPTPAPSGVFDGTLAPEVTIHDLTATTDIAVFTMSTSPGSETVRVSTEEEHYLVNWRTNRAGIDPTHTYRISVSVAGGELGYADVKMATTGNTLRNIDTDRYVPLLAGQTLAIKFRIEEGAVFVVGPGGGTFTALDGAVTLEVDPGALAVDVGITVAAAFGFPGGPNVLASTVLDFQPDGTNFDPPATLTLAYDRNTLPVGTDENALVLMHLIDDVWTVVGGSTVSTNTQTVSGPVGNFSLWAVGVPLTPVPVPNAPFVYTSNTDGDNEVFVREGTTTRQITNSTANDGGADWQDDHIAFHSNRTGDFDIWAVDDPGGTPINLTQTPGSWEFSPHWSPDGTRIGYTRLMGDGTFDVWVMNADGSGQVNLTDNPGHDAGAAWSPDGSQIVFQSRRTGSLEVYVMNRYGTGTPAQLTFDATKDEGTADWSPDGTRIVFSKHLAGIEGDIWVMGSDDGADQEQVTFGSSLDINPVWSADGTQILFERFTEGNLPSGTADIVVMTLGGTVVGAAVADPNADERAPAWWRASVPPLPSAQVVVEERIRVSIDPLPRG